MRLVYYERYIDGKLRRNFGDDINIWMWPRLLPGCLSEDDGINFAAIGTIFFADMMRDPGPWIVFGSGVGYGDPPRDLGADRWDIVSVRGPLTARILGIDPSLAVTDGAILLATLPEFRPCPASERSGIVFMPHQESLHVGRWDEVCRIAGIEFLNPEADSQALVRRIRCAKLVLADAMHAAIIADALRVPWVPVVSCAQINTFKWLDWTQTLELPYEPFPLGSSSSLERLRETVLPLLNQRFHLKEPTVENAIQDFRDKCSTRSKPWWPTYHRLAGKLLLSAPRRAYGSPLLKGLRSHDEEHCVQLAAQALHQVSRHPGHLSEDAVFESRLNQMVERLESIPARMERFRKSSSTMTR